MMKNDNKNPLFSISSIAKYINAHQRTLRIYDKEGILSPKRNEKNRRLYSFEDCKKAEVITFLTRNLGVNLAGVKVILELTKDMDYENCLNFLSKIASNSCFDNEIQMKNIEKYSKKGRKKQL